MTTVPSNRLPNVLPGCPKHPDHPELRQARLRRQWIERAEELIGSSATLDAEGETVMFKAMHACAFEAARLRNSARATASRTSEVRRFLGRRQAIQDELVHCNIGLVYEMRRRARVANVDSDDLNSEGMWTLVQSVNHFDPWRGYKFSTYACTSILRAYLLLAKKARRRVDQVGLLPEEADPRTRIVDVRFDLDTQVLVSRLRRALEENTANLTSTERFVIERRVLHASSDKPDSLEAIGRLFELSKERVRQIQLMAIAKLRATLEERKPLRGPEAGESCDSTAWSCPQGEEGQRDEQRAKRASRCVVDHRRCDSSVLAA